jgi:hypothetical protein
MGPLFLLRSGYWAGRFRDALMRRKIIYTSLPGAEDGADKNDTWYKRHRATVYAVMVSLALALVSFVAWSVL